MPTDYAGIGHDDGYDLCVGVYVANIADIAADCNSNYVGPGESHKL